MNRYLARTASVLSLAGLLLGATACGGDSGGGSSAASTKANGDPVKIGVPAAQTGAFAEFSNPSLQAIKLAADFVNRNGGVPSLGGAKVEIVASDTQSDPARATQLLQQIGAGGGLSALLGPMTSAEQLANIPTIDRLKIPLCSAGGDPKLSAAGSDYIFTVIAAFDRLAADVPNFVKYASSQTGAPAPTKVAVVASTALGQDIGNLLQDKMRAAGYQVTTATYDPAATKDFGPIVSKIASFNPDLVVGYAGVADGAQFAKAAHQLKFQPKLGYVWAGGGQNQKAFKDNTGSYVNGWIDASQSAGWADGKFGSRVTQFYNEYQKKYGHPMSALEGSELACFSIVLQAVQNAKSRDPQKVRDAMQAMKLDSGGFFTKLFAQAGGVEFNDKLQNIRQQPIYIQLAGQNKQVAVYPKQYATGDLVWPESKG